MRTIIYDVAVSLDGYIAGPDGNIDGFVMEGAHAHDYFARLQSYSTAIMGRNTYEFGYKYGMKAGDRPYPHMDHFIYSAGIELANIEGLSIIRSDFSAHVRKLKASAGGDIYLCGGGRFAGLLLEEGLIDRLILKVNPFISGEGTPLFATHRKVTGLKKVDQKHYESGVTLLTYDL
jgi:dihydrofolate reductase